VYYSNFTKIVFTDIADCGQQRTKSKLRLVALIQRRDRQKKWKTPLGQDFCEGGDECSGP